MEPFRKTTRKLETDAITLEKRFATRLDREVKETV